HVVGVMRIEVADEPGAEHQMGVGDGDRAAERFADLHLVVPAPAAVHHDLSTPPGAAVGSGSQRKPPASTPATRCATAASSSAGSPRTPSSIRRLPSGRNDGRLKSFNCGKRPTLSFMSGSSMLSPASYTA